MSAWHLRIWIWWIQEWAPAFWVKTLLHTGQSADAHLQAPHWRIGTLPCCWREDKNTQTFLWLQFDQKVLKQSRQSTKWFCTTFAITWLSGSLVHAQDMYNEWLLAAFRARRSQCQAAYHSHSMLALSFWRLTGSNTSPSIYIPARWTHLSAIWRDCPVAINLQVFAVVSRYKHPKRDVEQVWKLLASPAGSRQGWH